MPNIRGFSDMTSCEHYHCLYIADPYVYCLHRLEVRGASTRVSDEPEVLSVNAAQNVIATCWPYVVRKIKGFSSYGESVPAHTPFMQCKAQYKLAIKQKRTANDSYIFNDLHDYLMTKD